MSELTIVIGPGANSYPTPKDYRRFVFNIQNITTMESSFLHKMMTSGVKDYCAIFPNVENKYQLPREILYMAHVMYHIDTDGKQTILKDRSVKAIAEELSRCHYPNGDLVK